MSDWRLPTPTQVIPARMEDGATIILRRHGNPDGPRLLVSHGNGLAADLLFPFWRLLLDRFDIMLYDYRNHGQNPASGAQRHNFHQFVADNRAIIGAINHWFGTRPITGVFHSMSALAALLQAAETADYAALVLFDPPVRSPAGRPDDFQLDGELLATRTRSQPARFATRQQYVAGIAGASYLSRLVPGAAELMGDTLLRPLAAGEGFELCCPPELEAQVYEYAFGWMMEAADLLDKLLCPVKVVGGDPTLKMSFLPSQDLRDLVALDYDFIPGATYLMQLEVPDTCVRMVEEFMNKQGLL